MRGRKPLEIDHMLITALLFQIIYYMTKAPTYGWIAVLIFVLFVIRCISFLWSYFKR